MIITPFKLWIKSAIFSEDRWILFDIQEYEPLEPGEIKRELATELGEKWQKAIDEYWRRCIVALDWNVRARLVQQEKRIFERLGTAINVENVRLALEGL